MRVLVTGASGFIGSHLLPRLVGAGHKVIAYDFKPNISQNHSCESMRIITGDLSSGERLNQIVWEDVDVVVHLASAGVKASKRDWHECISVNIVGTEQLIHSMSRVYNPPLLIYPRTFYEDYLSIIPSLEKNPYVVTKKAGTKIVELWARENENAHVVFGTIFQAYGAGDDPGNVFTYTVNCLRNDVIAELGSGNGLRDWIYIYDLVDAFVKTLSLSGNRIQYYDFGTGKLTSIKKVMKTLAQLFEKPLNLLNFDHERDRGDVDLKAKANNFVPRWKPHFSVEEGLTQFVNDMLKNKEVENDLHTKKLSSS